MMETNNTPTVTPFEPSVLQTFNNLYPSLLQCFAIILLGYITARLGYISPTSSKGIGMFVGMIALPSLLFQSMVKLDFSLVNWPFLCSILISKSFVFFTVMLFTLALVRPRNLGKAGIYSIFSVNSNDFALGYPLLMAMYQDLHPDFIQYVYLIAPVCLICLNPIGFILMEIHKQRSTREPLSKCKVATATVKGVAFNPIVFMTFIGILGNFIFNHKMPAILDNILGVLGQAFLASALFFLGVKMVGSMTTKMGPRLMVPMLLIAAKVLLLPLVTRETIQLFEVGKSRNDTEDWSMFGFLYGTFPAAPTVAIYATKFGIEEQLMTSSMVMCTFLSAPIMFMSAQMSVLGYVSEAKINNFLKDTMVDISSISIPFGVWVILMFSLVRRHRVYPYNFTLYLIVCQLLVCVSTVLFSLIQWNSKYWNLTEFILCSFGCWGTRCWTAMVALSLYLVRCKGDQAVSRVRVWIHLFGWGVPLFSCGIAIALVDNDIDVKPGPFLLFSFMTKTLNNQKSRTVFQLASDWIKSAVVMRDTSRRRDVIWVPTQICAMVIMFVCVVITITSLVRLQRFDRYCKCEKKRPSVANQGGQEETPQNDEEAERCCSCIEREQQTDERTISSCQTEDQRTPSCTVAVKEIESLDELTCLVQNGERTLYTEEADSTLPCEILGKELNVDEYLQGGKHQLGRHVTMLLILLISMVMALFHLFWHVLGEGTSSGIYIALQTVDVFCIFGQSFVVFACFGLEKQLVIIPFLKRWRKLWYGVEGVPLPNIQDLDPAIVQLCDRFSRYHKQRCQQLLVSDERLQLCEYNSVFRGDELVNWLLEVGLATDRHAAVHYGNCLILGRVIRHVTDAHFFYDSPYLYQFC